MVLCAEDISLGWFEVFSLLLPFLAWLTNMAVILITLTICCLIWLLSPSLDECNDSLLQIFFVRLNKLSHYVAREVFRMKPSPEDTPKSPKTEFFGYVVPEFYLIQVFLMAVCLACLAVYAFINTFFVKESYECVASNRDLACFTTDASTYVTERVNCSTMHSIFNDTIPDLQCYEFVFDASEALSDAGGILTTGVVAITVTVTCVLCISKGEDGCKSKPRCICTLCIQVAMLIVIFGFLFVVPFIVSLDNYEKIFGYMVLWTFSCLILPAVCVPWCRFKKAPRASLPVNGSTNLHPQSLTDLPSGPPGDSN